jgi:HSP20 family protein
MHLIKVRIDHNIGGLHKRMQSIMDEMLNLGRPLLPLSDTGWVPEADMYETSDHIILVVNLAGVNIEDIGVVFHQNHLRIDGKRHLPAHADTSARYHQLEIGYGDFERIFRIPAVIESEHIEASVANGMLTVRMKKQKPRNVHVDIES